MLFGCQFMKNLYITFLFTAFVSVAYAQNENDIEKAIVIGELSKPEVRAQIIRVENDIFRFYNEHNGDSKLDIECNDVVMIGTQISTRVCEPVFWAEARAQKTQEFLQEFTGTAELDTLSAYVADDYARMNAVYAGLTQKYPSFNEALLILEDLKARLKELGD